MNLKCGKRVGKEFKVRIRMDKEKCHSGVGRASEIISIKVGWLGVRARARARVCVCVGRGGRDARK